MNIMALSTTSSTAATSGVHPINTDGIQHELELTRTSVSEPNAPTGLDERDDSDLENLPVVNDDESKSDHSDETLGESDSEYESESAIDTDSDDADTASGDCGDGTDGTLSDDENIFAGTQGLTPVIGDWLAVKVLQIQGPATAKGKAKAKVTAIMHFARVEAVEDDDTYTVSFVKRNSDGSYSWPDADDKSTVSRDEVVIMKSPSEEIEQVAGDRALKIKLFFDTNDIEAARQIMDIAMTNIR